MFPVCALTAVLLLSVIATSAIAFFTTGMLCGIITVPVVIFIICRSVSRRIRLRLGRCLLFLIPWAITVCMLLALGILNFARDLGVRCTPIMRDSHGALTCSAWACMWWLKVRGHRSFHSQARTYLLGTL